MKFATKIAAAATAALVLSAGSALAFNKGHFGGTAKYFASNASGATGHVSGKNWGYHGKGYLKVENSSEQYNSSYKKIRSGYQEFGGNSGGRNTISAKWKNTPSVTVRSNSGAFGASGITNRRF